MSNAATTAKDVELGSASYTHVPQLPNGALIHNPTYQYLNEVEKVQGYLSKQFPTIANPAPLGLCGFALTTFVLSMMNAGGLVCKFILSTNDVLK